MKITTMTETIQNTIGDSANLSVSLQQRFEAILFVSHSLSPILIARGSALQKRLRDREKETELDERDRKREKEELEEIRQRLLAEGHPDPDAELQRVSPCVLIYRSNLCC